MKVVAGVGIVLKRCPNAPFCQLLECEIQTNERREPVRDLLALCLFSNPGTVQVLPRVVGGIGMIERERLYESPEHWQFFKSVPTKAPVRTREVLPKDLPENWERLKSLFERLGQFLIVRNRWISVGLQIGIYSADFFEV